MISNKALATILVATNTIVTLSTPSGANGEIVNTPLDVNSTSYNFISTSAKDDLLTKVEEHVARKEEERIKAEKEAELERIRLEEERQKEIARVQSVTFNSNNLRTLSGVTTSELRHLLKGTSMESLAGAFVDAEKTYKINAFALCGLVAVESGWNTSARARGQNNLTGYAVYSDSSAGKTFSSPYECIMATARLLDKHYLNENGIYHNGYSTYSLNIKYSADEKWHSKINSIANDLLNDYRNNFNIY